LIARLLNRELDPAVLKEATALELQVFPQRWKDLQMDCSCPEWAVPCTHGTNQRCSREAGLTTAHGPE
jgi:uncharacterized Zn finger protein